MAGQITVTVPVVLMEEQAIFRAGLRAALQGSEFQLIKEYAAANLLAEDDESDLDPGAIVLCSLRQKGWQELAQALLLRDPSRFILGIADQTTDEIAVEAFRYGLVECTERTLPPERWIATLRAVHAGKVSAAQALLQRPAVARYALMVLSQPSTPAGVETLDPVLGQRERSVLANLAEEVPVSQIVERLGLSEEALHDALKLVCSKVGARLRLSRVLRQLQS